MDGRTSTALYVDRFLLLALALIWPVCAAIVSIFPPAGAATWACVGIGSAGWIFGMVIMFPRAWRGLEILHLPIDQFSDTFHALNAISAREHRRRMRWW